MASSDLSSAAKSLSELYRNAGKTSSTTDQQQIIVSKRFLKWLALPLLERIGISKSSEDPVTMLDLACGQGVVIQEVQDILPRNILEKSKFVASDNSEALVDLVKKRIEVEVWVNTEARVLDAMSTGLPDSSFTHLTISMGLHLIPEPDSALKEVKRLLLPNGIFGLSTPHNDADHSMWQPDIRSAFASFPFDAPFPKDFPTQMHSHGHWADPFWVGQHLQSQGFKDVVSGINRGTYHVDSADDFLMVFGGMLSWVMNGWWSEELRKEHGLEEVRELTRRHLVEKYEGKGWDLKWAVVTAAGKVDK